MIIDPIDLKLIRLLELHGHIPINEVIAKFHITEEEIFLRIKNFESSGFIRGYGMKLFIPAIAGGKWYWGCIVCETTSQFKPEQSVACLEEIVENVTFPTGVCPDKSLLFYTQSLHDAYKTINKTSGIKYAEIYKIDAYNVKVPRVILKTDWVLIKRLYQKLPKYTYTLLHRMLFSPDNDDEVRLSQLFWRKKNPQGFVSVFPNINWAVIKNYAHLHLAVTSSLRIKELRSIVNKLGFSGNITSRFKKRYIQIEFNVWGFSDTHTVFESLSSMPRINIEGCSYAYTNSIYHEWLEEYIDSKL
ncbi:MAG: Lrp/AsnC family transcriptional regulator [candidate division WOR-3 bacterium]|nr:MAG: Lrp/AsnC family transcriptional regulator [candidate division WOR-3 bacterium]